MIENKIGEIDLVKYIMNNLRIGYSNKLINKYIQFFCESNLYKLIFRVRNKFTFD